MGDNGGSPPEWHSGQTERLPEGEPQSSLEWVREDQEAELELWPENRWPKRLVQSAPARTLAHLKKLRRLSARRY